MHTHYENENAHFEIAKEIENIINKAENKDIVFLCIGTDRNTGDSLGPFVGQFLQGQTPYPVFGTIDEPVHSMNLKQTIEHINLSYQNPYIIAIDACLGRFNNIGKIKVRRQPLKPGAGVNKSLGEVGDIGIVGVVNISGFLELKVLANTRLKLVYNMAKVISDGLSLASKEKQVSF